MNAEKVHYLYLGIVAVGRKEVNLALCCNGIAAYRTEVGHRGAIGNAHLSGKVGHAVNGAVPHNILDIDIVANEIFLIVVNIYHTHKSVAPLPEIVQERRVLTERVI